MIADHIHPYWSWRDEPLDDLCMARVKLLADEGNEEAKARYRQWLYGQPPLPMAKTPRLGWFDGDGN